MSKPNNLTESQGYLNSYLILHKCADLLENSEVNVCITDYLNKEAERYFNLYLDVVLETEPLGIRKIFNAIFNNEDVIQ